MRRGFSILEFLIVCAVLLAASTLLLPRALEPRQRLNEEHAPGYLAMIGAAERAWFETTGAYASLLRLADAAPESAAAPAGSLAILLTPDLLVDDLGVAHRGGYRFRLVRDARGDVAGCWAWPNLPGYSGDPVYWADFADGTVRTFLEPWPAGTLPAAPPDPRSLDARVLRSF